MPTRPKRSIRQVDLGAANAEHEHTESDITDLDHYDSSDFNNDHANADHSHDHDGDYAELNHTHEEADITDLDHYTDADANAAIDARVNKAFVDALNVDADTVDGKHASAFADAVHTHVEADIADLDHYDSSDFAADHANADHTHDHDADYADIAHTHELDELNATGATDGHVLTAQGDGTAAWEPPTGGGGVTDHGDLDGLADDDHTQYLNEARHDADDHDALTITESQITDLDHYDSTDFDSDFATKDTDDLAEGATNLYLTDERVQDIIGAMLSGNTETRITVTYQDGDGTIDFEVDADLSNYTNTPGWIADITGENLEDLADVTITSIVSGEVLVWDGSGWVNQTLAEAGISAVGHTHTEADIADLDHTDDNAIHDNVSGEIVAITAKTTPVDADVTVIEDSEAANAKKSLSWANIKATLKTYFDTLYAAVVHTHTESDITDLDHWDQADTEGVIDAYVDKTFVDALNVDADTLDGLDSTDFASSTHDHDADYAASDHTHELDELDATGITDGHVLTAQGDGSAAWEPPTGGGGGVPLTFIRVGLSGNQAIPSGGFQDVVFDTVISEIDPDNALSLNGSGGIDIAVAGVYGMVFSVTWSSNNNGNRGVQLIETNTFTIVSAEQYPAAQGGFTIQALPGFSSFSIGDTIQPQVQQNSGGPLNIIAALQSTTLTVYRIG